MVDVGSAGSCVENSAFVKHEVRISSVNRNAGGLDENSTLEVVKAVRSNRNVVGNTDPALFRIVDASVVPSSVRVVAQKLDGVLFSVVEGPSLKTSSAPS